MRDTKSNRLMMPLSIAVQIRCLGTMASNGVTKVSGDGFIGRVVQAAKMLWNCRWRKSTASLLRIPVPGNVRWRTLANATCPRNAYFGSVTHGWASPF